MWIHIHVVVHNPLHYIENILYGRMRLILGKFSRLEEVVMKLILVSCPYSLSSMSPFLPLNLSTTFIPRSSKDTYSHSLRVCLVLMLCIQMTYMYVG